MNSPELSADLTRGALQWARFVPVLPVQVTTKKPLIACGVHAASSQAKLVEFWYRQFAAQDAGVGAAMGHGLPSGRYLFALDVDPPADGDHSLAVLESTHGELPETRSHGTPRGGTHFLLSSRDPVRCAVGVRPGLDVRGKGGYIVVPPTRGYTVRRRAPIAAAPEWLIEIIDPPRRTPTFGSGDEPEVARPRYIVAAIECECKILSETIEGRRNHQLNVSAFKLARFVAAGQADEGAVREALTIAAAFTGLKDEEIERTIDSAFGARMVAA